MLIHPSKQVLKGLKRLTSNTEASMSFLGSTTCICLNADYNAVYDYQKYKSGIHGIMASLKAEGYIAYEPNGISFCLTEKGLHPHQRVWVEIKKFLIQSVVVPVVVSLLTTLLTLWLKGLLPAP